MSILSISTEQLRRMGDQEGLVLQGCGGDPKEWLDGINQILTDEGILKKGAKFEETYTFQHDGVTCLLFPFKEGMAIEMGRLAMWRLQTHPHFGGTWLSDYVPNRLGGFLQEQEQRIVKPDCPLIGRDGNIYNLLGIAGQTLREHGMEWQANRRPGKLPHVSDNAIDWERYIENRKSSVRCKVEHAFRIIKCQFGYKKTVYRGLKKNENRLYAMFACANLYALAIAGRKLPTT